MAGMLSPFPEECPARHATTILVGGWVEQKKKKKRKITQISLLKLFHIA